MPAEFNSPYTHIGGTTPGSQHPLPPGWSPQDWYNLTGAMGGQTPYGQFNFNQPQAGMMGGGGMAARPGGGAFRPGRPGPAFMRPGMMQPGGGIGAHPGGMGPYGGGMGGGMAGMPNPGLRPSGGGPMAGLPGGGGFHIPARDSPYAAGAGPGVPGVGEIGGVSQFPTLPQAAAAATPALQHAGLYNPAMSNTGIIQQSNWLGQHPGFNANTPQNPAWAQLNNAKPGSPLYDYYHFSYPYTGQSPQTPNAAPLTPAQIQANQAALQGNMQNAQALGIQNPYAPVPYGGKPFPGETLPSNAAAGAAATGTQMPQTAAPPVTPPSAVQQPMMAQQNPQGNQLSATPAQQPGLAPSSSAPTAVPPAPDLTGTRSPPGAFGGTRPIPGMGGAAGQPAGTAGPQISPTSPNTIQGGLPFNPQGAQDMMNAVSAAFPNLGLGPLGQAYSNAYQNYLALNQQNYQNILQGYQQTQQAQTNAQNQIQQGYPALTNQIMGALGLGPGGGGWSIPGTNAAGQATGGGAPGAAGQAAGAGLGAGLAGVPAANWGIAAPAAQAIADTLAAQLGTTTQQAIDSGLGNTTVLPNLQRGANLDAMKAFGSLGAQLAQTGAGYLGNIGMAGLNYANQAAMQNTGLASQQLNWMNSVNAPPPSAAPYMQAAGMAGQFAQANATNQLMQNMANQQAALQWAALNRPGMGGGYGTPSGVGGGGGAGGGGPDMGGEMGGGVGGGGMAGLDEQSLQNLGMLTPGQLAGGQLGQNAASLAYLQQNYPGAFGGGQGQDSGIPGIQANPYAPPGTPNVGGNELVWDESTGEWVNPYARPNQVAGGLFD